jgi:hypothetical protein
MKKLQMMFHLLHQVELLNVNPAGSAGEIDHEATGPPLEVGDTVLIGTPLTSVNEDVL